MIGLESVVNIQKLKAWYKDPLLFVTEVIEWPANQGPSPQQVEILKKFPDIKRMTIRSGYGCGKDALSIWLSLWFVVTRYLAKVIILAPTKDRLYNIVNLELLKWFKRSNLQSEFTYKKDRLFQKDNPREWYIKLVSLSRSDQAELLAGYCSEHLLIIAYEASNIPDVVLAPLDSALTEPDTRILLLD